MDRFGIHVLQNLYIYIYIYIYIYVFFDGRQKSDPRIVSYVLGCLNEQGE